MCGMQNYKYQGIIFPASLCQLGQQVHMQRQISYERLMFESYTALFLPSSDSIYRMVFLQWLSLLATLSDSNCTLSQDHVWNLRNLILVHFVVSGLLETSSYEEV